MDICKHNDALSKISIFQSFCLPIVFFAFLAWLPAAMAGPIVTWDIAQLASSDSDYIVLTDKQDNAMYRANVQRVKELLKVKRKLERHLGITVNLFLFETGDGNPNAFAYKDGDTAYVLITPGLLELMGNDMDAYAFILGHEFAHIQKEHALQKAYLAQLMEFSRDLKDTALKDRRVSVNHTADGVADVMYGLSFSRDQEREADSLGLNYATTMGYDARGALRVMRALSTLPKGEIPPLLQSHPVNSERLSYLESRAKGPAKYAGFGGSLERHSDMESESRTEVFSAADVQLGRIAEAVAVIEREFVVPIDRSRLADGCLDGIRKLEAKPPKTDLGATFKDVVDEMAATRQRHPDFSHVAITDACLDGMVGATDRFSFRLTPDEVHDLTQVKPFASIGVEVKMQDEVPVVMSALDNGTAQQAGIRRWDLITRIDGKPTKGMALRNVMKLLRGPPHSKVKLTLERGEGKVPIQMELERIFVRAPSVTYRVLPGGTGYIEFHGFNRYTMEGFAKAMTALQNHGGDPLNGIVLDLRDNGGGWLNAVFSVASVLLQGDRLVARTYGRLANSNLDLTAQATLSEPPAEETPLTKIATFARTVPLTVLVNGETASGAEMLAAALQDNKRAVVVGTHTAGVGIISSIIPLKGGDAIRITTSLIQRPSGDNIANAGVIPDFTLNGEDRHSLQGADRQLDKATAMLTYQD